MNNERTLKEVCEQLKISRRTLQGYQKKGLIIADGKNKYGYLLFNEETIKRIALIRFYQRMGFLLNEITQLMNRETDFITEKMNLKIGQIENNQQEMLDLKYKAQQLIEGLQNKVDMDEIYEIIQGE